MNERELFEETYKWNYPNAELSWCKVTKSYRDPTEMRCWLMWQASANRDGYKLVPVEADDNMEHAGHCALINGGTVHKIYKAMIGAVDDH